MISKVSMSNVASYKERTELTTDKKTILMYGLNGTGKSTFSNYFYDKDNSKYKGCDIEGLTEEDEILVYNQQFVNDNFYEADSLKGIFTLSKENKQAKQIIEQTNNELNEIKKEIETKNSEYQGLSKKYNQVVSLTENKLWEVKTKYSGGDRVLEYCLDGLKGTKRKLFDYIIALEEGKEKPIQTIEEIKKEVRLLGNAENKILYLNSISINLDEIENNSIFSKVIVGNENSSVSKLINELGNSDWVKSGLKYIDSDIEDNQICPFCQSRTITKDLVDNIKKFFDESYERDIQQVLDYQKRYNDVLIELENIAIEQNQVIEKEDILKFSAIHKELLVLINRNYQLISGKIQTPSKIIDLVNTSDKVEELNEFIDELNEKIKQYNDKIDNKGMVLKKLKKEFWKNIRWDYDQFIKAYFAEKKSFDDATIKYNDEIAQLNEEVYKKKNIILREQKKTVNIDEAIININNGLIELGIGDFSIVKAKNEENMYKIVRENEEENIFKSLSEGEKMLISFLYFVELCRGKQEVADVDKKKIVVIDDPITSMSHVYIFNVGRMIHNEFLRSEKYEQVFILTHSLYFFYELVCMKKNDRDELQKLVRISKGEKGSKFIDMHYNEIENDYQSYWSIIKDSEQPPVLIANCMRNIIEYFFNFVEKQELSNVFQKKSLQANRFQAFYRYINRESHSIGQNIFDFKEFNYDDFKEAFRLVFKEAGYEAHYKKMMK